jgi:hypothetical protein
MGEMRNSYKILVGKPEWKRPLGSPRRRWEDNIRMDLKETEWEYAGWIHVTQDRDRRWDVENTIINFRIP